MQGQQVLPLLTRELSAGDTVGVGRHSRHELEQRHRRSRGPPAVVSATISGIVFHQAVTPLQPRNDEGTAGGGGWSLADGLPPRIGTGMRKYVAYQIDCAWTICCIIGCVFFTYRSRVGYKIRVFDCSGGNVFELSPSSNASLQVATYLDNTATILRLTYDIRSYLPTTKTVTI